MVRPAFALRQHAALDQHRPVAALGVREGHLDDVEVPRDDRLGEDRASLRLDARARSTGWTDA